MPAASSSFCRSSAKKNRMLALTMFKSMFSASQNVGAWMLDLATISSPPRLLLGWLAPQGCSKTSETLFCPLDQRPQDGERICAHCPDDSQKLHHVNAPLAALVLGYE